MVQIHKQAHKNFMLLSTNHFGFLMIAELGFRSAAPAVRLDLYKNRIMIFIFWFIIFSDIVLFYQYSIVKIRVLELVDRTNLSFVDVMS